LTKILLAYAHFEQKCLLVVMKDRSQGVHPNRITPSVCWKAFRRLVETVFCPMAELDIVHSDIRFDPTSKKMCYIVYFEENSTIEMAFIDFESRTVYPTRLILSKHMPSHMKRCPIGPNCLVFPGVVVRICMDKRSSERSHGRKSGIFCRKHLHWLSLAEELFTQFE
jgi:hypothetical protein